MWLDTLGFLSCSDCDRNTICRVAINNHLFWQDWLLYSSATEQILIQLQICERERKADTELHISHIHNITVR